MAGRTTQSIHIEYGRDGALDLQIDEGRLKGVFLGPPAVADLPRCAKAALATPLDFPPLEQAVIPDDRVVLVLDRNVPEAETLVSAVWDRLHGRGVDAAQVTVLQPADPSAGAPTDPRGGLPSEIRGKVGWQVHESVTEDSGTLHYLATTAAGERVYLSGTLLDADVVIAIGRMGFDSLIGYRGTNSVFFPGLSTAEAMKRSQGQGHTELGPDDERPLRQMVDEIGWLLGTQFAVQAVPSAGGGVSEVLAGAIDSVFRKGRELLSERWTAQLSERVETVVVAIDDDAGGHDWQQVAAALSVAKRLVVRDGRIIVLSQLAETPGQGMELLRQAEEPLDVVRTLRDLGPDDLSAATQFAEAVDWARVYLLSNLESDLVEDLFCVPVESDSEVLRLLAAGDESCVIIGSAQHFYAKVG